MEFVWLNMTTRKLKRGGPAARDFASLNSKLIFMKYDHKKVEAKWQKFWAQHPELYSADDKSQAEKQYILDMFPYPSGDGLHTGHVESYTATDIISRYWRMKGKNVLHPQGWDAFGLPAENYAIKNKVHPAKTTQAAIANFKKQMNMMGLSYDWSREVNSSDPKYYKWTQWFFLLLYKNGYAYKAKGKVNWCNSCQTVLANEQAEGGVCERCGKEVVQKDLEQWYFKITDFIENKGKTSGLLSGLDKIDWPESTKAGQRNWISKSEGAEFKMKIITTPASGHPSSAEEGTGEVLDKYLEVFTTRLDTVFGMTFALIAPEHQMVQELKDKIENWPEVEKYIVETKKKSELQRIAEVKEKTGVELKGIKVLNPFTKKAIPLFASDFVLAHYGTGAVMAVPGHDTRDYDFAKKFGLLIENVVRPAKQNCIIIHGSPLSDKTKEPDYIPADKKHWLPWLKENLEKLGIKTFIPLMPQAWQPVYADWKKEFEKVEINENTILIGHSAGGAFLARWLSETGRKVGKLILVAAGRKLTNDNQRLADFYTFKLNKNIKNQVSEVVIFVADDEEEYRRQSAADYQKDLDGRLIELKGMGHFTFDDMKKNDFPELLEAALSLAAAYTEDGVLINSEKYDGLTSAEARQKLTQWLEKEKIGHGTINYKMRDWLVSRQRYWGAPIPIIYCEKCGEQPVLEKDLPVLLPDDVDFMPTGESPLTKSKKFHDVKCPKCGGSARRESDTMDTFVCSSWYYLRYPSTRSARSGQVAFDPELTRKWLPVDLYVGGAEHVVLHLLYSRFFTKVLHNLGYIDFDEPFAKLRHQGMILAEDGRKMSKSLGNVITPDSVVEQYGADALRMFEMFMGPLEDMKPWNTKGIIGISRFLERIWKIQKRITNNESSIKGNEVEVLLHKTIKKVSEDIENLKFNTAISALMILANRLEKEEKIPAIHYTKFIILLSPFAPHMAEELWSTLGKKESIFTESWPTYDKNLIKEETIELVVQINGKVRGKFAVAATIGENEAKKLALADANIKKWLEGKEPKKVIFVKGRLVNVVV